MQPGVLEASERGVYDARVPAFTRLTPNGVQWAECAEGGMTIPAGNADIDVIIYCTGYNSNTSHLAGLGIVQPNSSIVMNAAEMCETAAQSGVFAVG